jgi:hypothetical protein
MIKKVVFLIIFYPSIIVAQSSGLGSWNIINVKYVINEKWSLFSEAQLRSLRFYSNFHYHEIKGGVNFALNDHILFTLAGGNYQTYSENGNFALPKNNNEVRLWPQFTLYQKIGYLKIEHRYRAEIRFTSNGYRNRFRYRLGITHPLSFSDSSKTKLYLTCNNELFFTDNEPYFERNRSFIGIQFKATKKSTLQLGYIHQFDYKINDETGQDFISIGYILTIK